MEDNEIKVCWVGWASHLLAMAWARHIQGCNRLRRDFLAARGLGSLFRTKRINVELLRQLLRRRGPLAGHSLPSPLNYKEVPHELFQSNLWLHLWEENRHKALRILEVVGIQKSAFKKSWGVPASMYINLSNLSKVPSHRQVPESALWDFFWPLTASQCSLQFWQRWE